MIRGRRAAALAAALVALAALAVAASLAVAPYPVPAFDAVRADWRSSDAWLLDRHGEPLARVRIDRQRRRGDWVSLDEASPAVVDALLTAEDRRFHEHRGIDWRAFGGAVRQWFAGGRRGGSTITMQLAAWLHPGLKTGGRRDLVDKWRQLRAAAALERSWTKSQILEAWLNLTPFRGEVEGIDAAARALAGRSPAGLDRIDAALLASLVPAPNAPWTTVVRRGCATLGGDADGCAELRSRARAAARGQPGATALDGDAPHLARRLLASPGERAATTLDARLQRHASATLKRQLRELEGSAVEDGAVIAIDNATGEVLAWVGSSGELSRSREVDGVDAPRQAGSTLKPFLYALAIERRLLTAASILDDSPLAVTTPAGLYVPQNYDRAFKGQVSLRTALASSLNVPAVRTLALVGYEPFHRRLRELGFSTVGADADHYGYALALGGVDVTLAELANAYRTLANGGRHTPLIVDSRTASAAAQQPVLQAGNELAAYIVGDILADAGARATTFGLASVLATRYAASVKTGTSKDMRDNWAIGYSDRYTVGVWVGNFSGAPMHDVSGITGAAPVWREVMDYLHRDAPAGPRVAPAGVVRRPVAYAAVLEPPRDEWFVAGTEVAAPTPVGSPVGRARIATPARGAIYAVDPDIPRDRQRITVSARGATAATTFVFDDGRRLPAQRPALWLPAPGRHEIALLDAGGRELDRVRFEVRVPSRRSPPAPGAR